MLFVSGDPAGDIAVRVTVQGAALDGGAIQQVATSGADGRFTFGGLPSGKFSLTAETRRFRVQAGSGGLLAENGEIEGVLVVLARTKEVRGILRSPAGEPVAEAVVRLDPKTYRSSSGLLSWEEFDAEVRSDETGRFVFESVPRVPLGLSTYFTDYVMADSIHVPADSEFVEVNYLWDTIPVVVRGIVLDAVGGPVAGAQVVQRGFTQHGKTQTDARGEFELGSKYRLNPGSSRDAEILVVASGYAARFESFPLEIVQSSRVEMRLEEQFVLEGFVVDEEGVRTDAGLRVKATGLKAPWDDVISRLDLRFGDSTAADGFRMTGLWPGEYDVLVRTGSTFRSRHLLDPRNGPFVLQPMDLSTVMAVFEVTASDAATGERFTRFKLGTYRPGSGAGIARDWPEGRALGAERAPGDYRLTVDVEGYCQAEIPMRLWDVGRYSYHVALPAKRSLRLRCIDEEGEPVPGLKVTVPEQRLTDGEAGFRVLARTRTTQLDGRCWTERLPDGTTYVTLQDERSGESLEVSLDPEYPEVERVITLPGRFR